MDNLRVFRHLFHLVFLQVSQPVNPHINQLDHRPVNLQVSRLHVLVECLVLNQLVFRLENQHLYQVVHQVANRQDNLLVNHPRFRHVYLVVSRVVNPLLCLVVSLADSPQVNLLQLQVEFQVANRPASRRANRHHNQAVYQV